VGTDVEATSPHTPALRATPLPEGNFDTCSFRIPSPAGNFDTCFFRVPSGRGVPEGRGVWLDALSDGATVVSRWRYSERAGMTLW
jgi:hypothetical protein